LNLLEHVVCLGLFSYRVFLEYMHGSFSEFIRRIWLVRPVIGRRMGRIDRVVSKSNLSSHLDRSWIGIEPLRIRLMLYNVKGIANAFDIMYQALSSYVSEYQIPRSIHSTGSRMYGIS
jgi:hypothetical protein